MFFNNNNNKNFLIIFLKKIMSAFIFLVLNKFKKLLSERFLPSEVFYLALLPASFKASLGPAV